MAYCLRRGPSHACCVDPSLGVVLVCVPGGGVSLWLRQGAEGVARRAKTVAACRAAAAIPSGVANVGPDMVEMRPTNLSEGDSTMTSATMALIELAEK